MCRNTLSRTAGDCLLTARTAVAALGEELQQVRACAKLVRDGIDRRLSLTDRGYFARLSHAKCLDAQNLVDTVREQLAGLSALCLEEREPEVPPSAVGRERMRELWDAVTREHDRAKDCPRCGAFGGIDADGRCHQCGWFAGTAVAPVQLACDGDADRDDLERGFAACEDRWADERMGREKGAA